jgi:nicotinamidase-related amidase
MEKRSIPVESGTMPRMSDDVARQRYAESRSGGRLRLGASPAVLVVDLQRGFTDPSSPVGADLTEAVVATRRLLDVARRHARPVIFTCIAYDTPVEAGIWLQKMPGIGELRHGSSWVELDARLARARDEPLIVKKAASALFGTNLSSMLTTLRADTVVVAGATTSGCVRASVVDLMQAGWPALVPAEGCGDRAPAPHEANLFDMDAKYADVVSLDMALAYIEAPGTVQASSDSASRA